MKAVELLELFNLPNGMKLRLQDYEIEMLFERALEYKMSDEELDKLRDIIREDKVYVERKLVYNLLTGETTNTLELAEKYKLSETGVLNKMESKKCIGGIPYSFDKDEIAIFHKVNVVRMYRCNELNKKLPFVCWKKYFNDDKLNITAYCGGRKYKNKYTFIKEDIILLEVL